MSELKGISRIRNRSSQKLVISYRPEKHQKAEEHLDKMSNLSTSSIARGKIFRAFKAKIKQFERAAQLLRSILSNRDEPSQKLTQIDLCIQKYLSKDCFIAIEGDLNSKVDPKTSNCPQTHSGQQHYRLEQMVDVIQESPVKADITNNLDRMKMDLQSDLGRKIDAWSADKQKTVNFYKQQIQVLHQQLKATDQKYQKQIQHLENKLKDKITELVFESGLKSEMKKTLQNQLVYLKEQNQISKHQLYEKRRQNEQLIINNKYLKKEMQLIKDKMMETQIDLNLIKEENDANFKDIEKLIKDKQTYRGEMLKYEKALESSQLENQKLKHKILIAETQIKSLQSELTSTKLSLSQTEKELKNISTQNVAKSKEQQQIIKNNQLLVDQVRQGQRQTDKLKKQFKKIAEQKQILQIQFDCELTKIKMEHQQALAEKTQNYESKLKTLNDQNRMIKRQMKQIQGKLKNEQEQKNQLHKKNISISEQISGIKQKLEQREEEKVALYTQRQKINKFLGKLDLNIDIFLGIDPKSTMIKTLKDKLELVLKDKNSEERQKSYLRFFDLLRQFKFKLSKEQLRRLKQKIVYVLN